MSECEPPHTPGGRSSITILVHGVFDRPGDAIAKIIDNALHDAGLCGCDGPENGYTLSVRTDDAEDGA